MSQEEHKTISIVFLFLMFTLSVLAIESCTESAKRRQEAETKFLEQQ